MRRLIWIILGPEEFRTIVRKYCGGGLPSARKTSTKVSSRGDYLSRIAQLDQRPPSRTMSAIGGSGRAATKEEVRV